MRARTGLDVRVDVEGEVARLAPDLEMAASRIVKQALANNAAHSEARAGRVKVDFEDSALSLVVWDDSIGFTPPEHPADLALSGHFGLLGMQERPMLCGGHLKIESEPERGTTIAAWLPIV